MTGSLIVGPYDLMDLSGPAILSSGRDMGNSAADTSTVARILLDGDVVSGARSGNRMVTLPIWVRTGTRAGDAAVVAALFQAVDRGQWSMLWTPDESVPQVVFDCWRGQLTQTWDYTPADRFVTLTFPAQPFTRSAVLSSASPTASAGVLTLATGDTTTGLVGAPGQSNPNAIGQDFPPSVLTVDTTSHVTGTGSVLATSPPVGNPSDGYFFTFAAGGALTATDFSVFQMVSFSMRVPDGDNFSQYSAKFQAILTDSTGKTGNWTLRGSVAVAYISPSASWARIFVNIKTTDRSSYYLDTGFNITAITGWQVSFLGMNSAGSESVASPELFPFENPGSPNYVNLLNAAVTPGGGSHNDVVRPVASGTMEFSTNQTVAVTAGSTYSGSGFVPDCVGSGRTYQCGVEWLNSTPAVISTSYGSAVSPVSSPLASPGDLLASPTAPNVTAPTGAVTARIRFRVLGAVLGADAFRYPNLPHIVPGAVAWSYQYGTSPGARGMEFDNIQALPAGSGVALTSSYGSALIPAIGGVARTPATVKVNAASGTPNRVLIARTPTPDGRFTPFLDTSNLVTSGGGTDTAALTGHFVTVGAAGSGATFRVPASAYNSTYAVLARMTRVATANPTTITVTAQLTGDSSTTTTCSRTYVSTAGSPDAIAWPGSAGYSLLRLGTITLPPRGVAGGNTAQTIDITFTSTSTASPTLDLAILVDLAGEMMLIDAPTGHAWYWIDQPTDEQFTGAVYGGTDPSRSDAVSMSPWQSGQAVFNFTPGANLLTVVLDQASSGGTVDVAYYAKWPGEAPM